MCVGLETQSGTTLATTAKKRKNPDDDEGTTQRGPPKRPVPAFLIFSQEQRPQVRAMNPSLKSSEVSHVLGEMWKECKDQAKYKTLAAKERERYDAEVDKYFQSI